MAGHLVLGAASLAAARRAVGQETEPVSRRWRPGDPLVPNPVTAVTAQ